MNSTVQLIWITPNPEQVIGFCARVSNPANQANENVAGLISYCIRNKHWSVFEMASMCVGIETTRDISRQILRHRSFSFQEFSQRYASIDALGEAPVLREARLQDTKNRQNSISIAEDDPLQAEWENAQREVWNVAVAAYKRALDRGIAKEQARALLPEGMTRTRMYMSGTIRSWIHYVMLRSGNGTQREHAEIAKQVANIMRQHLPTIMRVVDEIDQ